MCTDIKEVKATNSKDSGKEVSESNPCSPHSPDLATCNFHLFRALKDALSVCCFADYDKLKCNMLQKRGLCDQQTESHVKAEKVC